MTAPATVYIAEAIWFQDNPVDGRHRLAICASLDDALQVLRAHPIHGDPHLTATETTSALGSVNARTWAVHHRDKEPDDEGVLWITAEIIARPQHPIPHGSPVVSVPAAAVLIGGRSGVGKSSVGLEVHAQLSAAGVRHCLIEGDFLDMAYPLTWEQGLAEQNLAGMWANYRALGYRRMVYTNTASVLDEVADQLTAAMGDSPTVVGVLLTCTDETARRRLSQREIGSGLDDALQRSAVMAHRLDIGCPPGVHRVVTDERGVGEIAAEIIRLSGWLTPESPGVC
ncbi:hypothetical protein AB0C34_17525 [Nocardia sp. NPDC049220]|uniref:hypothetical protein n=1 Tax=Nocardia sp. NPDC049220 TaxID=3155273 RepID=UPI0034091A07